MNEEAEAQMAENVGKGQVGKAELTRRGQTLHTQRHCEPCEDVGLDSPFQETLELNVLYFKRSWKSIVYCCWFLFVVFLLRQSIAM